MRRKTPWTLALAFTLLIPAVAYAINLNSPGGFIFDIQETFSGALFDGSSGAYDTMYTLNVNGAAYSAGGVAATTSLAGRQIEMAEVTMGTLRVRRLAYVPTGGTGQNYCRYLDLIRNPGASAVAATVTIEGGLGSDLSTIVTGTSSGDTVFSIADDWLATDDMLDGTGDPSLAHVLQGPGVPLRASAASIVTDRPTWSFNLMVPAGGQVGILTFAIQEMNRAASIAEARRILDMPADVTIGLDAYARNIVNFAVGGAPIVHFTAPAEIDEGSETLVEISVEDREGDPSVTWSWDLDGDGTFGDTPGATTHTIPAGTTDGDGTTRVGVEATDGTDTRRVYRTIVVNNVPPLITSAAPTTGNVSREYTYTPVIEEPAGTLDPIRYILVSSPMGMMFDAMTETIRWTPNRDQRARTFDVTLRVDDGDGGEDMQMWRIVVADNSPPDAPVPVSPIDRVRVPIDEPVTLVVTNAIDLDGDELVYFFRVSQESSFTSPDVIGSGEISEGAGGTTEWTTLEPLSAGLWYWEIWVDDGTVESFHRYAQVVVGDPDIPGLDAGPRPGTDGGVGPGVDAGPGGGGGGCRAAPGGSVGGAWLLGLVALCFVRRRARA